MDDFVKALNGAKGDLDAWRNATMRLNVVSQFSLQSRIPPKERKRIACAAHASGAFLMGRRAHETGRFWDEPKNAQPMSWRCLLWQQ